MIDIVNIKIHIFLHSIKLGIEAQSKYNISHIVFCLKTPPATVNENHDPILSPLTIMGSFPGYEPSFVDHPSLSRAQVVVVVVVSAVVTDRESDDLVLNLNGSKLPFKMK